MAKYKSVLDKDGYNIYTGFNRAGWNREGMHRNGTRYNDYGYDIDGYDSEGFDYRGLDREGFNREGLKRNKYGRKFYNRDGIFEDGSRYDGSGYGPDGYSKTGYNKHGLDRRGFNRKYIHHMTGTLYDPDGYNCYGVDVEGKDQNGVLDPDVQIIKDMISCKVTTIPRFARERGLEEDELKKSIELGLKKVPSLKEQLEEVRKRGMKQLIALLHSDAEKVIQGKESINDFWANHPRASFEYLWKLCGQDIIDSLVKIAHDAMERGDIEGVLSTFTGKYFDYESAWSAIELSIRRSFDRETKVRLYDLRKFLKPYGYQRIDPYKKSLDGGKTWIDFSKDDIEVACQELKEQHRYVCTKTVKEYLVEKERRKIA